MSYSKSTPGAILMSSMAISVGCASTGGSHGRWVHSTIQGTICATAVAYHGEVNRTQITGMLRPGFAWFLADNYLRPQPGATRLALSIVVQGDKPGVRSIIAHNTPKLPDNAEAAQFSITLDKKFWSATDGTLSIDALTVSNANVHTITGRFVGHLAPKDGSPVPATIELNVN